MNFSIFLLLFLINGIYSFHKKSIKKNSKFKFENNKPNLPPNFLCEEAKRFNEIQYKMNDKKSNRINEKSIRENKKDLNNS